ncbi:tripartite tricarboxylate transporter TctB family protein [Ornithinimicrobium ciconiae]|uniref:Tripartite tricarboxylate transporter TctB family protein n=1 Tax=Ornithinimicrobium ciconiae TaxID=2594265 RepID=A0A516GFR8_9MICO|nr:tripartite tricarboxylate transporter TctB family protein [Ornithinimicrobium ciconiae]
MQHGFWTGRSGLVVPAIIIALGFFLIYGINQMEVGDEDTLFGPKAFPWIAAVACFVVGALLAVQVIRSPEVPEAMLQEDGSIRAGSHSNWPAALGALGSFVGFALILETVGWIIAAALVFWGLTVSLGNRRYALNLLIGLAMSSIMQLVFSGLLGLNLPSGVMGG